MAFRKMVEAEVLTRIRKVKPLRDISKRLRYLSKEECNALIRVCDPHLKPIVITARNTGMRRGEVLNLKRAVDILDNAINEKTISTKLAQFGG